MPRAEEVARSWLQAHLDQATRHAITAMLSSKGPELEEAFGSHLEFGTAGMRGLMGTGSSRMNQYTVRIATQGLSQYLLSQGDKPRVVIGYDCRHGSSLFAQEAARVLAGNGIQATLLRALRPTPFLSFACRQLDCAAGIMITASHNPPTYNGYKVYGADGAQVVSPADRAILREVGRVASLKDVMLAEEDDPLIQLAPEGLEELYLKAIAKLRLLPEMDHEQRGQLSILYTPLHGTGITLLPEALKQAGFKSPQIVQNQATPDGNFPAAPSPNPEAPEALALGIQEMVESGADIFLATDPDADRIGVALLHRGKPYRLSGNELAALCLEFICKRFSKEGRLSPQDTVVSTLVTTELLKKIAAKYGIQHVEVLTGFKYIGEKIREWENHPEKGHRFLFGAEESLGYLFGTHARDKDAIVAGCLIAEMALEAKLDGKTLFDRMQELYATYGHFLTEQISLQFPPSHSGLSQMGLAMQKLRSALPTHLGGRRIIEVQDYLVAPPVPPKSDLLLLRLEGGVKLVFRPSGTEPKLKIYGEIQGKELASTLALQLQELLKKSGELLSSGV